MNKEAQERIEKLQSMEQQMQAMNAQKQQVQSQLFEVESALGELENTEKAYKIVGGIMVASTPQKLTEELTSKKDLFNLRLQTLEKQEKNIRENVKKIQEQVMETLKK